jgi:hypothetical protein
MAVPYAAKLVGWGREKGDHTPHAWQPRVSGQSGIDNLPEYYEFQAEGKEMQVKALRRNSEYMSCVAVREIGSKKWNQICSVQDARRIALGQGFVLRLRPGFGALARGQLVAPRLCVSIACLVLYIGPIR